MIFTIHELYTYDVGYSGTLDSVEYNGTSSSNIAATTEVASWLSNGAVNDGWYLYVQYNTADVANYVWVFAVQDNKVVDNMSDLPNTSAKMPRLTTWPPK